MKRGSLNNRTFPHMLHNQFLINLIEHDATEFFITVLGGTLNISFVIFELFNIHLVSHVNNWYETIECS